MRVWCALNQKGGAGKTTLLLQLLITAWLRLGKVCLIDLDPQRSAAKWWDLRAKSGDQILPVIEAGAAGSLKEMLAAAHQKGVELVLVDTPGAIDRTLTRAAAEADLIILPTRTARLDIDSLADTLGFLDDIHALAKAIIIINGVKGNDSASGIKALAERYRVPVASIELRDSAVYAKAIDQGQGILEKSARSAAARDIEELFDWLTQHDGRSAEAERRATA